MTLFYNNIIDDLNEEIKKLTTRQENSLQTYEVVIDIILQKIQELKKFVLENEFKDQNEEIHFFKQQKPGIFAKLIYYNAIFKIEAKKPFGGKEVVEDYLNNELSELKRFYDRNIEFCKYYRTNGTYLDHKYFVRGQHDVKLSLDTFFFEADPKFSTSHDYKIAKIMANDRLQIYLENQLVNNHRKTFESSPLTWTASKAAATELIYGLHSQGVFNNGNADLITIARYFEITLNIDLGDFYHTFLELKTRKINQAKFLDSMRDALIKRMEEHDEK